MADYVNVGTSLTDQGKQLDIVLPQWPDYDEEIWDTAPKAITILDYMRSVIGEKDSYSAADHLAAGVQMIGGCGKCEATLASYNAYPSRSGYWLCADCVREDGFATVEEFNAWCDDNYEEPDEPNEYNGYFVYDEWLEEPADYLPRV